MPQATEFITILIMKTVNRLTLKRKDMLLLLSINKYNYGHESKHREFGVHGRSNSNNAREFL